MCYSHLKRNGTGLHSVGEIGVACALIGSHWTSHCVTWRCELSHSVSSMSWAALLVAAIALLFVQSTYEHHTGEQLVRGPSKGDRADANSHCQLQVTSDLVIRTVLSANSLLLHRRRSLAGSHSHPVEQVSLTICNWGN